MRRMTTAMMLASLAAAAACSDESAAPPDSGATVDAAPSAGPDAGQGPDADTSGIVDLGPLLAPIRDEHGVPALAAEVATTSGVLARGVAGVRKLGDDTVAEIDDLLHLGSCTKAMTATVVATFVEEGALTWDTSLAEAFPELADSMHADFETVSLADLMHHRAGIDDEAVYARMAGFPETAPVSEQRAWAAELVVTAAPDVVPGSEFRYSNVGYVIVGAALERASGQPWEELIAERLFTPLGMASCGFGAPGSPGVVDQPWGHDGATPIEPGPLADNIPFFGPAGTVHCSIDDWSKFAVEHMRGARGESDFLVPASFERMHQPWPGGDYALGWGTVDDPQVGQVLAHDGSNTLWYARVVLLPDLDRALLIATNRGDSAATDAVNTATAALDESYVTTP